MPAKRAPRKGEPRPRPPRSRSAQEHARESAPSSRAAWRRSASCRTCSAPTRSGRASSNSSASYNNELMLGRIRPLTPGAGDDRRRRLLREPLPLLPGGPRRAGARPLRRSGARRPAVVANYRAAPLLCPAPARDAGFHAGSLSESPDSVGDADRAALRKAGFSDEDIFDIAEVAGFYNMTNRLAAAIDMRPNAGVLRHGALNLVSVRP